MSIVEGSNMAAAQRSVCMLSNNTAVVEAWAR